MEELNADTSLNTLSNLSLSIQGSPGLIAWMAEQRTSFALTTGNLGKLFFIGLKPDASLSIFERTFPLCMGLCGNEQTLYVSSLFQLWRFENALYPGQLHQGHDKLYIPQVAYTTGNLSIRDLALDKNGRIIFVNSLFNCIATVSETYSFVPLWQPPFITQLIAEDRCHLTGIALEKGDPKYVTAAAKTDTAQGWVSAINQGGIVMDVTTNQIIAENLSLPHSPRVYQDKLWLLNSGKGEFGFIDTNGNFEAVTFCPGFLRGLSFVGDYAIVGLSKPHGMSDMTQYALPLNEQLIAKKMESQCGIQVIDLRSGNCVHHLYIEGLVEEIVNIMPVVNVFSPMALGLKSDEIQQIMVVGEQQPLFENSSP